MIKEVKTKISLNKPDKREDKTLRSIFFIYLNSSSPSPHGSF